MLRSWSTLVQGVLFGNGEGHKYSGRDIFKQSLRVMLKMLYKE